MVNNNSSNIYFKLLLREQLFRSSSSYFFVCVVFVVFVRGNGGRDRSQPSQSPAAGIEIACYLVVATQRKVASSY